eukprot:EG_transcript_40742
MPCPKTSLYKEGFSLIVQRQPQADRLESKFLESRHVQTLAQAYLYDTPEGCRNFGLQTRKAASFVMLTETSSREQDLAKTLQVVRMCACQGVFGFRSSACRAAFCNCSLLPMHTCVRW